MVHQLPADCGRYLEMGADICGRQKGASALLLQLGRTAEVGGATGVEDYKVWKKTHCGNIF